MRDNARVGCFVNNCRIPIREVMGSLDARELQMRKLKSSKKRNRKRFVKITSHC